MPKTKGNEKRDSFVQCRKTSTEPRVVEYRKSQSNRWVARLIKSLANTARENRNPIAVLIEPHPKDRKKVIYTTPSQVATPQRNPSY